ncbi:4-alpha-glucanotransferase [Aliiglaciecola sp. 3_MG-2023]|uniref:4-alpha-glucanotransferase n=1 Tax=Aliiglaciecola sp. 3_MG-2023 TaxID=3062644 RepID=UPI0026E458D0|nr:4-alpha-glucanotransferase [Aliiglaciecola sp. 3_MG-2023]MDO6692387.1 4-alpha-glucanotransferase [Aliiglaciecola sp. 3_MG-2023]
MTSPLIDKLVDIKGVETNYIDAWGNPEIISEQSKCKLLGAMGYQVDNEELLINQVEKEFQQVWMSPLNPVQVNRESDELFITVRLPIELVNDDFVINIECENNNFLEQKFVPIDGDLINATIIEDIEFQEYLIKINHTLPLGYHQLRLLADDGDQIASMRMIMAPTSCYHPQSILDGNKVWGLSVQLYCLRSRNNWGIGDFSDLAQLVESAAKNGAQFIGLNPIHALYPANPEACSPYGPSSRRWLNFIYLDVTAIDGYHTHDVQSLVNDVEFQRSLDNARNVEYVDYEVVTRLKLQALDRVFAYQNSKFLSKNTKQNKAFKTFVTQGGESLQMLATYDALQEHLASEGKPSWGWPVFPKEYADFQSPAVSKFVKKHKNRIKFYLFLQWQAALQLEAANQVAKENNMSIGIYRDLAVGVSEGSAEIWGNKDLYCTQASVGAPPDVLGPLGQNWGLPPMDPEKLYEQQYQPIIDLFDSNMKSAGALRIDHVMALLRLWWVAKGDDAKEGGYVYYPVDDLLGILALESQRHRSLVIGEDLGTVPEEIRVKLAENGVYSYRVFFFEQAKDGGFYSPSDYPIQSMSTLTTHDMPTLSGYWHCYDLELGKELGLYPTEEILSGLYASRHNNKQQILDSLHGHHAIPEWIDRKVDNLGMSKELNYDMQIHMATGSSALLSLQLEDWLQMNKPVNIPGTFKEYPNWKRKLNQDLEHIFSDPEMTLLAKKLTEARDNA